MQIKPGLQQARAAGAYSLPKKVMHINIMGHCGPMVKVIILVQVDELKSYILDDL
jgi:hypothetical protein